MEQWIYTPQEKYKVLLEKIRNCSIAQINKAKISDFLWIVENDFASTKMAEMMTWKDKQDASSVVKELLHQLEDLDKEEALCYFASFLPIPEKSG